MERKVTLDEQSKTRTTEIGSVVCIEDFAKRQVTYIVGGAEPNVFPMDDTAVWEEVYLTEEEIDRRNWVNYWNQKEGR